MTRSFGELAESKLWHPSLERFVTEEEFKKLQSSVNLDNEIEEAEKMFYEKLRAKQAGGPARKPSAKENEDMGKKDNEKMKKAVAAKMKPAKESKTVYTLVKENPYRAGSAGEKKFAHILKAGKTGIKVDAYLKAGGQSSDLGWGKAHKFLEVK